jgi:hypothetical protein
MIGTRLFETSIAALKISICSSVERVGASPVVPQQTIAWVPSNACQSIQLFKCLEIDFSIDRERSNNSERLSL